MKTFKLELLWALLLGFWRICLELLQAGFLVLELYSLLQSLPRVCGLVPEVEVSPRPWRVMLIEISDNDDVVPPYFSLISWLWLIHVLSVGFNPVSWDLVAIDCFILKDNYISNPACCIPVPRGSWRGWGWFSIWRVGVEQEHLG